MKEERLGVTASGLRNVLTLGIVSFFTDTSSEMVFGLIPTFVVDVLGASPGLLGLIEGSAEAMSYYLRLFSGALSDRVRTRKPLVVLGYGISSAAKPFFAAARTGLDVLLVRLMERTGKGVRTAPRDALLSASVEKEASGTAFGIHRALDQSGAIVGPIIAALLLPVIGLRSIFLLSLIPAGLAVIVLLLFVKEHAAQGGKRKVLANFRDVLRGRYLRFLVVVAIFSAGAYNFSFILLKTAELGLIAASIPLAFAVINATHTAVAAPAGALSDRVGRKVVLGFGYGVFGITSLLAATLTQGGIAAFLIAAVYGVYAGIIETIPRAMVPDYVDEGLEGTSYGLYYLVVGTFFFVANNVLGLLWDILGPNTAFLFPAATSAIAIVALSMSRI